MGAIEIEWDPLPCKWCERPIEQRSWWRLKRFCNRWHRLKYRLAQVAEFLLD
ncbi:hypothetical protein J4032_02370 [Streptomyces formicae]|uniref:Mobile element protein n=1 Tax=Streptomyces formicae TaxID=1616117 RepID=A0ABY3WD76_9ACTN|nr:hypothetical protein [Streptomyces formicae]UNM10504.1 hypothetical protein J4032_02370 [Streptomyces formicae]